jgi:hypothetical protein
VARVVSVLLVGLALGGASASAVTPFANIGLPGGPLTTVAVGNELGCQLKYSGDAAFSFYPSSSAPGDCGTFVEIGGTLFTPDLSNHPSTAATPSLGARTPFTPISQPLPSGAGTAANPRTVITTVSLGATGIQIVQTDRYVAGREYYTSNLSFSNTSGVTKTLILYRAGDCQLNSYGFSTVAKAVGCSDFANNTPAGRVVAWTPRSPGANFTEDGFSAVWSKIGAGTLFPDDCAQCSNLTDSGAGISWSVSVPAGAATAVRGIAAGVSPTGKVPPVLDPVTPASGGAPLKPAPLAFGAKTGITLELAQKRIGGRGPVVVLVSNRNGFRVSGKLSGRTARKLAANGGKRRHVKLKTKSFSVPANGKRKVALRLPSKLRRLLQRKAKLALRFEAVVRDPAGNVRRVSKRLAPKLKKKRVRKR